MALHWDLPPLLLGKVFYIQFSDVNCPNLVLQVCTYEWVTYLAEVHPVQSSPIITSLPKGFHSQDLPQNLRCHPNP